MALTARHDPIVHRFKPDPEIVARAQRDLMDTEDEAGRNVRFVRQKWEETFGATRVALAALREIYPSDRQQVSEETRAALGLALDDLTSAWAALDDCSSEMLGATMQRVLAGEIRTHAHLDIVGVDRYDNEA